MAANEKRVLCTLIVEEIALHGEHPPRKAHVSVEATNVSQAFRVVQERVMAQLKGKR